MTLRETTTLHNEEFKTHEVIMTQKPKYEKHPPVDSWTVWRWPEFQNFIKRLGFDMEAPTTGLVITIPLDGIVSITHEFRGLDTSKER